MDTRRRSGVEFCDAARSRDPLQFEATVVGLGSHCKPSCAWPSSRYGTIVQVTYRRREQTLPYTSRYLPHLRTESNTFSLLAFGKWALTFPASSRHCSLTFEPEPAGGGQTHSQTGPRIVDPPGTWWMSMAGGNVCCARPPKALVLDEGAVDPVVAAAA